MFHDVNDVDDDYDDDNSCYYYYYPMLAFYVVETMKLETISIELDSNWSSPIVIVFVSVLIVSKLTVHQDDPCTVRFQPIEHEV